MKPQGSTLAVAALASLAFCTGPTRAQIPPMIGYQGRIVVDGNGNGNGTNFNGTGHFRFSLVDETGATTYWENDPTEAIDLDVDQGRYEVLLGDTTVTNMAALPPSVFAHEDVRLRVEFDDGVHGMQELLPNGRIVSVAYAYLAGDVVDGAITAAKLAPGAVGLANLNLAELDDRYVEMDGDEMAGTNIGPLLRVTNSSAIASGTTGAILGRREGGLRGYGVRGEHAGDGTGVLGLTEGSASQLSGAFSAIGVRGSGTALAGINVGVFGDSASPEGFGGYFENNGGPGGVGLYASGGDNFAPDLVLGGNGTSETNDDGRIFSDPSRPSSDLWLHSNNNIRMVLNHNQSGEGSDFHVGRGDGTAILNLDDSGRLSLNDPTGQGTLFLDAAQDGASRVIADVVEARSSIVSDPAEAGSDLWVRSNNHLNLVLDYDKSGEDSDLVVRRGDNTAVLNLDESGALGLSRADTSPILHIDAAAKMELTNPAGLEFVQIQEHPTDGGGEIVVRNAAAQRGILLEANQIAGDGARLTLYDANGVNTLTLDADQDGSSRVITEVLEITGGSDLSEQFEISTGEGGLQPEPGMIVSIDPERPGQLRTSSRAYDPTVAGIISGAGGVRPGMLMGQRDSIADGAHPVALTGRVYCYVDADHGAVEPGDFITTSDTPGHGMAVTDHQRARGAILGKAMTGLEEGTGLVLVLVSLQ